MHLCEGKDSKLGCGARVSLTCEIVPENPWTRRHVPRSIQGTWCLTPSFCYLRPSNMKLTADFSVGLYVQKSEELRLISSAPSDKASIYSGTNSRMLLEDSKDRNLTSNFPFITKMKEWGVSHKRNFVHTYAKNRGGRGGRDGYNGSLVPKKSVVVDIMEFDPKEM